MRIGERDTGDHSSLTGHAMAALEGKTGRYLFISTPTGPGADEDSPRRTPVWDTEVLTNDTYGPCKVACEYDVMARYNDRSTIVRPAHHSRGLIQTCAEVAGTTVEITRVPDTPAPLVRADWSTQQRSNARALAAGMPITPLRTTTADVHAWELACS